MPGNSPLRCHNSCYNNIAVGTSGTCMTVQFNTAMLVCVFASSRYVRWPHTSRVQEASADPYRQRDPLRGVHSHLYHPRKTPDDAARRHRSDGREGGEPAGVAGKRT